MLILWRRHKAGCTVAVECRCRKEQKRECHCCRCPIWSDGYLGTERVRKSLDTGDWAKAGDNVREIEAAREARGVVTPTLELPTSIPIEQATKAYIADAEARQLNERTIYKYKLLFRQLAAFAKDRGFRFLEELDTPALRAFRASWKDANLAALKKLERMRSFMRFAQENRWISGNPLVGIKSPKVTMRPTLPFDRDEMIAILEQAQKNIAAVQSHGRNNARRLHALILLLRYSGLRIGDAVSCSVDRLVDGKLRLYTQKTGTHVHCPLPDFVVRELDAIPKMSERYWFWTGNGKLQTAVGDWQGRLAALFTGDHVSKRKSRPKQMELPGMKPAESAESRPKAKVKDGHAHRFRDTFAVELLLAGVPLERVSILLGHQSVKITEKHYSPWIRERQEQAEADVRRTWSQDPIALMMEPVPAAMGTYRAHGKKQPIN